GMRVPDWGSHANLDIPDQEKGFARMIDYIDKDVGRIISVLDELKIDDNTIVMFSSDNGPHQEGRHKMEFFDSNGPLRGMKRDLYEGGIRVPFIVRWPGTVPSKEVSHHISGFQDMFPTLLDLAGIESVHKVDGISMVPTLLGKKGQRQHDYLYWEFGERGGAKAVLKGNWKGVRRNTRRNPNSPIEIYNLKNDLAETTDLAGIQKKLLKEFKAVLKREHVAQ
ncbi:MAG: sulfatase-like hydrolase/transferase, partial [Pseudomonadales bacterium]|nr:sulfatase-like hydrolase/transferase [Pseudomonadales bacterium]